MRDSVTVKINYDRIVTGDGKERVLITKLEGLKKNDLPDLYVNGIDNFYFSNCFNINQFISHTYNKSGSYVLLEEGGAYLRGDFEKIFEYMKKCDDVLMKINQILGTSRLKWCGSDSIEL